MEDKHKLTEKLKVLETELYEAQTDLNSINYKLNSAYKYEDELVQRQVAAKKKTEEMRQEFFEKSSEIAKMYDKMKDVFDVFTGNFYNE